MSADYERPQGVVEAAKKLLSEGDVSQVYQVTLRDCDKYEDKPRMVTFIPIGSVIGIAVHAHGTFPKDSEIVFVAAAALGNAIPALGFTGAVRRADALVLQHPENNA